ncbi:MAG: hypothetical protein KDC80_09860 [Saprospiraceae bacterium]|nr:hypothetical protein [Saprospiraceae bacterium]
MPASKNKLFLTITIISLLVVAFLAIVPIIIRSKIDHLVKEKVPRLEYEALNVSLLRSEINFREIKGGYDLPGNSSSIEGTIASITFGELSWIKLLKNVIDIGKIRITRPDLVIWKSDSSLEESGTKKMGADKERSIHIGDLQFEEASLNILDSGDSLSLLSIDTMNCLFRDIRPGKSNFQWKDLLHNFEFDLQCLYTYDTKRLHNISINSISGNSHDSLLTISQFNMVPGISDLDFMHKIEKQTHRMFVSIPAINIYQIAFIELPSRKLRCGEISIPFLELSAFLDKNKSKKDHAVKKLPQNALAKMDFSVDVDSMTLENGYFKYSELIPGRKNPGEVSFEKTKMVIHHLTNDSLRIKEVKSTDLFVKSELYGDGPIRLQMQVPLSKSPWTYYLQGQLTGFALPAANQIIEPSFSMFFRDGYVSELSFQATANPIETTGNISFFYRDLDIDFQDSKFGKRILDNIVEAFVFPQENVKTKKHNLGKIYCKRDQSKSIFNYLWLAVFSGIQSTILPNIILPRELKHTRVDPEGKN